MALAISGTNPITADGVVTVTKLRPGKLYVIKASGSTWGSGTLTVADHKSDTIQAWSANTIGIEWRATGRTLTATMAGSTSPNVLFEIHPAVVA